MILSTPSCQRSELLFEVAEVRFGCITLYGRQENSQPVWPERKPSSINGKINPEDIE